MADELDILFPEIQVATSKGSVTLKPLTVKQYREFGALVSGIKGKLTNADGGLNKMALAALMVDAGTVDDLIKLSAGCSDQEPDWFDDLNMQDLLEVVAQVLGLNLSFFAQALRSVASSLGSAVGAGGGLHSSASLQSDTTPDLSETTP